MRHPNRASILAVSFALSIATGTAAGQEPGATPGGGAPQTARTGHPLEYGAIEETMAPAALELIGGWIRDTAAAGGERPGGSGDAPARHPGDRRDRGDPGDQPPPPPSAP